MVTYDKHTTVLPILQRSPPSPLFFPKFTEAEEGWSKRNRLEKGDIAGFPLYCEVTCIKGSNL